MAKKVTSTCAKARKTTSEEWKEQKPVELVEGKTVYGICGHYLYNVSDVATNRKAMTITCFSQMKIKILSAKFDKGNLITVKDRYGRESQMLEMMDDDIGKPMKIDMKLLFNTKKDANKCALKIVEFETVEAEDRMRTLASRLI